MVCDALTGREVEPAEGVIGIYQGVTFMDENYVRYMVLSIAYGETKVMKYDEYTKRVKN